MGECSVRQRWRERLPPKSLWSFPSNLANCTTAAPHLKEVPCCLIYKSSCDSEKVGKAASERKFVLLSRKEIFRGATRRGCAMSRLWRVRRGLICGNLGQIFPSSKHYCILSRHFVQDGLFVLIFCETFLDPGPILAPRYTLPISKPHICPYWYTTALFRPVKIHQKCANSRPPRKSYSEDFQPYFWNYSIKK